MQDIGHGLGLGHPSSSHLGDHSQLKLDLSDAAETERAQRDRDLDNLRHRLAQIPSELAGETAHLRARYENPQPRLCPLAVIEATL